MPGILGVFVVFDLLFESLGMMGHKTLRPHLTQLEYVLGEVVSSIFTQCGEYVGRVMHRTNTSTEIIDLLSINSYIQFVTSDPWNRNDSRAREL